MAGECVCVYKYKITNIIKDAQKKMNKHKAQGWLILCSHIIIISL